MSRIKNEPTVTDMEIINVRRAAIEQRAKWAGAFLVEARKDGIDLEPIMRRAIYNIGLESGKAELAKMGGKTTSGTYGRYFVTKKYSECFEKKIEKDGEDDFVCSLNYCPLCAAWQKMGLSDDDCALLCDIAMEGDRGIAAGLGLDFDIESTKAKGAHNCMLHYRDKK